MFLPPGNTKIEDLHEQDLVASTLVEMLRIGDIEGLEYLVEIFYVA